MTLEQLAEGSGLTPNYIGTIENGKRDPSLSTILSLAKGLRVHPAELFGGVQDLSAPATEAGLLFDGAPIDVQDAVLQLLRSVGRRKMAKTAAKQEVPRAVREAS
jgi:transcriptional regulator with XRE-family HTH domain